jgi:hypothetical protein
MIKCCAIEIWRILQLRKEIRVQMPGTTVLRKLNQGSIPPLGGITCLSADRSGGGLFCLPASGIQAGVPFWASKKVHNIKEDDNSCSRRTFLIAQRVK